MIARLAAILPSKTICRRRNLETLQLARLVAWTRSKALDAAPPALRKTDRFPPKQCESIQFENEITALERLRFAWREGSKREPTRMNSSESAGPERSRDGSAFPDRGGRRKPGWCGTRRYPCYWDGK